MVLLKNAPWVLGISASHNGAVCLLKGEEIVVAIQEERLTRQKRAPISGSKASTALAACLHYAGIKPSDLSLVVISGLGPPNNQEHNLKLNPLLQVTRNRIPTVSISHHLAHAVSAFATSGFEETAILVVDGMGSVIEDLSSDERSAIIDKIGPETISAVETISLYSASDTSITAIEKHVAVVKKGERLTNNIVFVPPSVDFNHPRIWDDISLLIKSTGMPGFKSLGGMYSAVAHQIFYNMWEAGKVMGLAPFGRPEIPVSEFFEISDGHFKFHDRVPKRFEYGDRWPLRRREYENLACSVQAALEEALMYLVNRLHGFRPGERLCYGGGVALNSIANERIIRDGAFKEVYIIPAAEDSGSAIGAAYYGLWQLTKKNARRRLLHDALGPRYTSSAILGSFEKVSGVEIINSTDVISDTVDFLCDGKILGWFQGRSELGPRSLGQRSIICDPRCPEAKDILNSRVKHREAYRPFAPAILLEEAENWFEFEGSNPESAFMLRICKFRDDKIDLVPAVVHVDGTGRLQTLTREANGRFYDLVKRFYEKTGVPILLNTSFNVAGEPIVETPEHALACLLSSGLDGCVLEDKILMKKGATKQVGVNAN